MEVAEKLGLEAFASLANLLDAVDALVIATPTTTHAGARRSESRVRRRLPRWSRSS
jgi:hypothetical protein